MAQELRELTEARELLGKFEANMHTSEGLAHLSEGLSLLADIRTDGEADSVVQVASNIAIAYMKKVHAVVERLIVQEPPPHWEIVGHWGRVFGEFERSGFTLPAQIAETRSKLLLKKWEKDIAQMPPTERQEFIRKLQARDGD